MAIRPQTRAQETRQSPKPSGAKTGARRPPSPARRDSDWSATTFRRMSKVCRNQMTTLAAKMMVNALVMKPLALSQASSSVVLGLGRR